ncbi:ABC transporter permease [Microbacterium sp. No. 7]|uniref:ABC transporter permease n=1 Tax=Microbacterium sp. No. 7 TaxID=1714373 RepID=UPI0006D0B784|nr:ABC transporter permease [Microbacterium sp. No. 7]ALJ21204.1 ABC transporter permease [Microbacterium sp. No. 7]
MTVSSVSERRSARTSEARVPYVAPPKKKRSIIVMLSYAWLALIVLLAIFANVLPIASFDEAVGPPRLSPQLGGDINLLLGTDGIGRSLLSRTIFGAQVSLVIGAVAGLAGFTIGTTLGLLGGYLGKRVDNVVTLVADVLLAFPGMVLLLALTAIFTPSVPTLLVGLSLLAVPTFTRLSRANTIAWSNREFVRAAKNMGAGNTRILIKEILPNVIPALTAYLPLVIAALIVAEGSLSFLGLGVPPPTPSWGGMINAGRDTLGTAPHITMVPAAAIFLTVFSLNHAGDHLRIKFDRTMHD